MSRVTEMAEAEADEVEAEEEDANDDGDDSEVEAVTNAPAPSPVDAEKALVKMEAENARHAKRVAEIMGADFELVYPCGSCEGFAAGFTFSPPDSEPDLIQGDEFQRCTKCNGRGQVATGAWEGAMPSTTCRACNGQGYIEIVLPTQPLPPMPGLASPHASLANELRAQGFMVIDPPAQAPTPGI